MLKHQMLLHRCMLTSTIIQGSIDNAIFHGSLLLEVLSTLTCLFHDSQAILELAILKTKSTMSDILQGLGLV